MEVKNDEFYIHCFENVIPNLVVDEVSRRFCMRLHGGAQKTRFDTKQP